MKRITLLLLICALSSCSSVKDTLGPVHAETSSASSSDSSSKPAKSWTYKDRKVSLHLGPAIIGDDPQTASYYSITPSQGSSRTCFAGSYIAADDYSSRGKLIEPTVHYSPSGKTILIDEEVTDASPLYQLILVYFDTHLQSDWIRHIALPTVPTIIYPERSIIISITDDEIVYRLPGKKKIRRVLISEVPDDIDRK